MLIQALGNVQRLVCGIAVLGVGGFLQVCQAEQQWWQLCLRFLLCLDDSSASGLAHGVIGALCLRLLIPLACTGQLHFVRGGQGYLPEGNSLELFVLEVSLHNHHQRRCLYPADGIERLTHDATGLSSVHAYQPVGFAPCLGSKKEIVIVAVWLEIG